MGDKQCAEYASYFMMIFRNNMRLNLPKEIVTLLVCICTVDTESSQNVLFKSKLKHTHTRMLIYVNEMLSEFSIPR